MTHRIAGPLVFMAATVCGQAAPAEMPAGLFRGSFVSWSGSMASGEFTIRTSQNADLFCYFDSHSYMERDHRRIPVASLAAGEKLEILADHKPGSSTCYARTVAVIDMAAERAASERARQAKPLPAAGRPLFFTPRGDRTLAGMVVGVTARTLTLKTTSGHTTLALRPDTSYVSDGIRSGPTDLRVNTRVFVRAGRTIDGAIEAYQVMWGEILDVQ
ncbi:MAG: hypothetical protein JO062_21340 [Bryobacterales bacterium]|nr:hypothetical protein [Bryobacterales bacterium]